jgi:hypothetical protein
VITLAWEVGDLVITGLLLALTAGVMLAGMLGAAVGNAGVWAWRRIRARAGGGPRRGLTAPRSAELSSRRPVDPETAERRSEPPTRKEAA